MIPLSFAQRRLWFLAQMEGPSPTYNVPWRVRLSGALDAAALEAALGDVVERHESLRTVFPVVDGEPHQVVLEPGDYTVELERREVAAEDLVTAMEAAAAHAFDLATEIPLRAQLFRIAEDEHVLVMLLHHIASDGWSLGPFWRDLVTAWDARTGGNAPEWEPLEVQYADYTLWQLDVLGEESDPDSLLSRQAGYWREKLTGAPQRLRLPSDRPRPPVQSHRGAACGFELPAATHRGLVRLAQDSRTTMFMILHAAVGVVLSRLGAGDDLPIGTVVAGRTDAALDDLVGFFVNTLILRTDTSGDPTFRELLDRTRRTDLEAYAHQDIPFDKLVEDLNPERSTARHPLFQVLTSFQNAAGAGPVAPAGLAMDWDWVNIKSSKFDLDFSLEESLTEDQAPDGLSGSVLYAVDLFDAGTAAAIAGLLETVLTRAATDGDLRLSALTAGGALDAAPAEALLTAQPQVEQAVVLTRHDDNGTPTLTAYLRPADGTRIDTTALHALCARELPAGLVPTTLTVLAPEPDAPGGADDAAPATAHATGARTAQEEILCSLFGDVLGREDVGPHDNFFALGGHSLLATRLISRVRKVLGAEAGIRDLFHAPTPAALAKRLQPGGTRPALQPLDRPDRVPLSYAQQRLWFLAQMDGPSATYNVPWRVRLSGALDPAALESALNDLVARHESLRTVFPVVDGEPHQVVLAPGDFTLELERREVAADELATAMEAAAAHAFDLATEIPLRARLFRVADGEHVLVMLLHHIASDGWSLGPFWRDLVTAWDARTGGNAPAWEPLEVQYADYTLWQHELLGDETDPRSMMSGQATYWREKLTGAPQQLRLPTDRPRPAVASHRGGSYEFELPAAVHRGLVRLAQDSRTTMFMILHAAVGVVLSRIGAGTDLPIGTVVAGRDDAALDDLVGFFVNTLILRTDTSGDPTFRELLDRVRRTDLEAYGHQDIPFDKLVEDLNPERSTARHPLFQVLTTLQNAGSAPVSPAGLDIDWDGLDIKSSKFDLDFTLVESLTDSQEPAGMTGGFLYATDLFDRSTALAIAGLLETVLTRAATDGDLRLSALTAGGALDAAPAEALLTAQPQVEQAVVLTRHDDNGTPTLTAYLRPADGTRIDTTALHALCARELPAGLVPTTLTVVTDELAADADTEALPAAPHPTAARSAQEEILCGLFGDVLGIEDVGPHDNFFALGGHSLLATRLISRVRKVLGAEAGIRDLFHAPTPAALAKRLQPGGTRPALQPLDHPDRVPLSYAQQRLWFLAQFEGPSTTYNAPWPLRLTGELDASALEAALNDLVARHESLRTVFPALDGEPCQLVLPADRAGLVVEQRAIRADEVDASIAEAAAHTFDLSTEIPVRAWVFRISERDHVLVVLLHHIASDGWSMTPLLRDLSAAYAARSRGAAPQWTELAVQYADYTLWQRDLLGEADAPGSLLAEQIAYWRGALDGLPEELELPADRLRPAVPSYRGGLVEFHLDPALREGVQRLARESRATLFMVLQAGLAVLMSRTGAGTDIPLGTPVAGRTDEALDDLVGFFINTLVLRTDVSGDPSFRDLVERVRDADLGAYAHQDLPFERLVEEVNPVRSAARHPLFQIMLTLHNMDSAEIDLAGLGISSMPFGTTTAKYDMSWDFAQETARTPGGAGIQGALEYAEDLFDRETAQRMTGWLVRLLAAAAADPDLPVSQLPLLDGEERQALLDASHGPEADATEADRGPVERFRAHALARPAAVAVVDAAGPVDYATLAGRAGALSRRIAAAGAVRGDAVAVLADRGAGVCAAFLGILGLGCAYVPLDPNGPASRAAERLDDCGVRVILADPAHRATAERLAPAAGGDRTVIVLDAAADPLDGLLPPQGHPDDLAYVIFTSGSTGRPKGAMVHRRGLVNNLLGELAVLGLGEDDTVGSTAPLTFDISVWQMLAPLVAGGTVRAVDDATVRDPRALFGLAVAEGVTVLQIVPSLLRAALDDWESTPGTPVPLPLRHLVVTGEALPADLCRRWFARYPDIPLVNGYGPAECSDDVSHAVIEAGGQPADGRTPIGRPVRGTLLYVLDASLSPVPVGVRGELYVGGVGVGRGYLADAARTAASFVPDPFRTESGARMYRTGDIVRRRADGQLEFLGRADHQVKIRGQRIELGEVEHALRALPDVQDAVVVALDGPGGHKRLVGYYCGTAESAPLRAALAGVLPDAMVPGVLVRLAALPLSPNGKIDRRALPVPDPGPAAAGREPRTPREGILCGVMAEVLGLESIGLDDGFFDLGGHSLLVPQLLSRVRAVLGADLPLRAVFESPTAAGLAERLGESGGQRATGVLLPIRPAGEAAPLFCVHPVWGLSWGYYGLARQIDASHPVYGIQARGIARPEPLPRTVDELVDDYLAHIRRVRPAGPYRLLGWSQGGNIAQAMAVRLRERGEEVELLALVDAMPTGPLPAGAPGETPAERLARARYRALREICQESGYEPAGADPLFTEAGLAGHLAASGSPLALQDPATLALQIDSTVHLARLFGDHEPGVFDGDVLFFTAGRARARHGRELAALWGPYVTGRITDITVDAEHTDMLRAEPSALIGREVNRRIALSLQN